MAAAGSAIVCDYMETALFAIVRDLRSAIHDRPRSSAIIWKPAFSPEATASSASKAKETSVLSSKNIHEETKTWGFPHTAERTS